MPDAKVGLLVCRLLPDVVSKKINFQGDDEDEATKIFTGLAEGRVIEMPSQKKILHKNEGLKTGGD